VGTVLGRLVPGSRYAAWLVPGGARAHGAAGGLLAALAAAAAIARVYPNVLQNIATPSYGRYFGLEKLGTGREALEAGPLTTARLRRAAPGHASRNAPDVG
jgi:hypothetical protein